MIPSLVLAYLAQRSLRDQEWVVEQQQRLLYQEVSDRLAIQTVDYLEEVQRDFGLAVDALLSESDLAELATGFDQSLRKFWPEAEVGFVVSLAGVMTCPSIGYADPLANQFLRQNHQFFCNQDQAEVYLMSMKGTMKGKAEAEAPLFSKESVKRKIQPEHAPQGKGSDSDLTVTESAFSDVVGESQEGMLSRFLDDELNFMVWRRLPQDPDLVIGAKLNLKRIRLGIAKSLSIPSDLEDDIAIAVLDETAKPVAYLPKNIAQDWARPFVATEIGDALPHWEAAVYLMNPNDVASLARSVRWSMGALLGLLVLLIVIGSVTVFMAMQRRMTLVRQQTDFVSNVSHELKTPLTAIRMFSEMMAEGRVSSEEKRERYLRIISGEANRLTRLINNVLNFSNQGDESENLQFQKIDLTRVIRDILKNLSVGLEEKGFKIETSGLGKPCWVDGDEDALSQVFVNVISNAEKYSVDDRLLSVELSLSDGGVQMWFKDRGMGFAKGDEERVFEQFYRSELSVKKGIQGSGLGLTLSRKMVEAHQGRMIAMNRKGEGTAFGIWLPLQISSEADHEDPSQK
ncbi:HAMP domain-containing histidine kinase [bacterium]|nr:HAMP domain-containing histidine kinase [bacterium]